MKMKKTGIAFVLVSALLVTCAGTSAQTLTNRGSALTPVPALDLSKLNVAKILKQLQTPSVQPRTEDVSPLQVVAEFLQLTPSQISELGQLLQARQTNLVPLLQTAQNLTQQLANLLDAGTNPAEVGAIVIQIHVLQQQAAQVQQAFVTQFTSILTAEQQQKLQAVQIAVQLQPILPAFQPIFLF